MIRSLVTFATIDAAATDTATIALLDRECGTGHAGHREPVGECVLRRGIEGADASAKQAMFDRCRPRRSIAAGSAFATA